MKKSWILLSLLLLIMSCNTEQNNRSIDLQGHRGCRGLMPENTIASFKKALDIGVTTLEMDLVMSGDNTLIVSHEPFFSHEISKDSLGNEISQEEELNHNLYQMSYQQIKSYDVGSSIHDRFPEQRKFKTYKPSFSDVYKTTELYTEQNGIQKPYYNVEIKRRPEWDNSFHPEVDVFTAVVVSAVQETGFKERITIQSFDKDALRIARKLDPEIKLVLLVENDLGPERNIAELGFVPEVYSPEHILVDQELVAYCKEKQMKLIPWTINEIDRMALLYELGVDGIITDYPDRFRSLAKIKNIKIQ